MTSEETKELILNVLQRVQSCNAHESIAAISVTYNPNKSAERRQYANGKRDAHEEMALYLKQLIAEIEEKKPEQKMVSDHGFTMLGTFGAG